MGFISSARGLREVPTFIVVMLILFPSLSCFALDDYDHNNNSNQVPRVELKRREPHPWSSCHHYCSITISISLKRARTSERVYLRVLRYRRFRIDTDYYDVPKFEMLASLEGKLLLGFARGAFES